MKNGKGFKVMKLTQIKPKMTPKITVPKAKNTKEEFWKKKSPK